MDDLGTRYGMKVFPAYQRKTEKVKTTSLTLHVHVHCGYYFMYSLINSFPSLIHSFCTLIKPALTFQFLFPPLHIHPFTPLPPFFSHSLLYPHSLPSLFSQSHTSLNPHSLHPLSSLSPPPPPLSPLSLTLMFSRALVMILCLLSEAPLAISSPFWRSSRHCSRRPNCSSAYALL